MIGGAARGIPAALAVFEAEKPSPADLESQGRRLLESGNAADAIPQLERAIRIAPGLSAALANLGAACFSLGRIEECKAVLEKCIKLDPEDATARYDLAVAGSKADRHGDAIAQYNEVLRCGGEKPIYLIGPGRAHVELNEAAKAMKTFDRAVKADPKSAEAWKWKSRLHQAPGQAEEAERCLTVALALEGADREARGWLQDMHAGRRR